MGGSTIFIGIAVLALVGALIVGNLKKMPFKKIESVLEKIEKKEAHINGTAIGLFFIGLVLLLGLYFTSDDFRDFSTLYVKPREVCRLPGGWRLGGRLELIAIITQVAWFTPKRRFSIPTKFVTRWLVV